jgi:hypothetical protein
VLCAGIHGINVVAEGESLTSGEPDMTSERNRNSKKGSISRALISLILLGAGLVAALPANAQQKGQYVPGQFGLNAGILPDPGITYESMTINFSSDTLNGPNGNKVPLTGSYDIWAVENYFIYVPKFKILHAKLAFAVIAPTLANGSLTLGSINFPNVALQAGGTGLADTWVQPLTLGWSFKRADIYVAEAFVAPTGRYSPGANNNVGSGYWGNHFVSGETFYLTKNKGTSASLFTDWEVHGSKQTGQGTTVTPGSAFTMEWGVGQIIPIKKDFSQLFQVGVIGFDQWQVSNNGGFVTPTVPASLVPYYSSHAIGFQTNYILPAKGLNFFFKLEEDYRSLASPQGQTIVFGGSYTFRIPKPQPPRP